MNYFEVPKSLHEVFGEKQTRFEVSLTLAFGTVGCILIYLFFNGEIHATNWLRRLLGFLLIGDILAGCIANFSYGTNAYYAARPVHRWVFIALHVHVIVVAWFLDGPMAQSIAVWAYTIVSASIVNRLNGTQMQMFVAANLMCGGLLLVALLEMPAWFAIVCIFFIIKVVFSFSVNHYADRHPANSSTFTAK